LIKSIKDKINTLARQKSELDEQVKAMEEKQARCHDQIRSLQAELKAVTEKNKVLKMAKSLSANGGMEESNTDSKHKINELVREIDKCIALLNK